MQPGGSYDHELRRYVRIPRISGVPVVADTTLPHLSQRKRRGLPLHQSFTRYRETIHYCRNSHLRVQGMIQHYVNLTRMSAPAQDWDGWPGETDRGAAPQEGVRADCGQGAWMGRTTSTGMLLFMSRALYLMIAGDRPLGPRSRRAVVSSLASSGVVTPRPSATPLP